MTETHDNSTPNARLWQSVVDLHPYRLSKALSEGANPNVAREDGHTPLGYLLHAHTALDAHSRKKLQDMLGQLLQGGADPAKRSKGELPYQTVARLDHPGVPEKLFVSLLRGCDKTAIDEEVHLRGGLAMSALGHAFRARNVGRARELMQRGADPWKALPDGQPCWIHLLRTNWKSIDRHRNPHPARLARELVQARTPAEVLEVVALEAELLEEGAVRRDGYGAWAMSLVQQWMLGGGALDQAQLQRLAKCAGKHFAVPGDGLLAAGIDPDFRLPTGKTVAWQLLESEDETATRKLMEREDWDMTTRSSQGEDLATFLRKATWLDVEKKTRETWISRAQAQLLAQATAHPTTDSKPRRARL